VSDLSAELQTLLEAYRNEPTAANWTALSQLAVGNRTVLDALKSRKPDFPDPLPLPVDGLIEDDAQFYQWSVLPDPEEVEQAIRDYPGSKY
jgi:hypothetical protein